MHIERSTNSRLNRNRIELDCNCDYRINECDMHTVSLLILFVTLLDDLRWPIPATVNFFFISLLRDS